VERAASEERGLALLTNRDKLIYSAGISTAGAAEIQMAKGDPERRIIATTIDREGALFTRQKVELAHLSSQIEVKIEDLSLPLLYPSGHFDFVYSRLALHYLKRGDLMCALRSLRRILKPGGRLFVVVCAQRAEGIYDPETGLTHISSNGRVYSRHFHTEESISAYLISAGFTDLRTQKYLKRQAS
jgi:SAM-dependent methyltransferase